VASVVVEDHLLSDILTGERGPDLDGVAPDGRPTMFDRTSNELGSASRCRAMIDLAMRSVSRKFRAWVVRPRLGM
jgi:hypothetical protein